LRETTMKVLIGTDLEGVAEDIGKLVLQKAG